MTESRFNPEKEIPDLLSRVILVTGGTSGVGKETIEYLLPHHPANILSTGCNNAAADGLISESAATYPDVKLTYIACDLNSLASVRTSAEAILKTITRLDLLLCVAGTMCNQPGLSPDGYEIQFATNHLGHAYLIKLLLPLLRRTVKEPGSDVRVVITTSRAAREPLPPIGGIQFDKLRTTQSMFFGTWRRYGQSKLAKSLYAHALSKHVPGVLFTSVHPGISFTPLTRNLTWFDYYFMYFTTLGQTKPPNELAWNGLWSATHTRGEVVNGAYYELCGEKMEMLDGDIRGDSGLAERLWEWTEEVLDKWDADHKL